MKTCVGVAPRGPWGCKGAQGLQEVGTRILWEFYENSMGINAGLAGGGYKILCGAVKESHGRLTRTVSESAAPSVQGP